MIVGIDLGTTNSLVAYYTQDGSRIIPNRLGKHLLSASMKKVMFMWERLHWRE